MRETASDYKCDLDGEMCRVGKHSECPTPTDDKTTMMATCPFFYNERKEARGVSRR